MERLYIVGSGKLLVKEKCMVFQKFERNIKKEMKIPVNSVKYLFCIGKIGFSPKSLRNILKKEIITVISDYNGYINGCIVPINRFFTYLQFKQYEIFNSKRLEYAEKIVEGLRKSSIFALSFFNNKIAEDSINEIRKIEIKAENIQSLMAYESQIWKVLYNFIRSFLPIFETRIYNPPKDKFNCIISFGYSLLYSIILSHLIREFLNPKLGFLHEPDENRNSLVLDLSELFKPIILLLLDFKIAYKNLLPDFCFTEKTDSTYLNDLGKVRYLGFFERFLNETFYSSLLKRKIKFEELIKIEIKNLRKSIEKDKEYEPLKAICL
ncbi:MAG: CRISPR-associated endonuclease Cas1 [Candidatus Aenigmatarchaeota archaeon]